MPHPASPDLRRSVEAALAVGDADAALALVRSAARNAAEDGAGFRDLVGRLPERIWQHDVVVASGMGASLRSAGFPRAAAAIGYFVAAEAGLVGRGREADGDRMRVWLGHATALRALGRFEEAQGLVDRSRELDRSGTVLSVPLRVELAARAALESGMIDLQFGRLDEARTQLSLALGFAEDDLTRADHVEALGGLALVEYFAAELDEADRHVGESRRLADEAGLLTGPLGAPALTTELLIAIERHDVAAGLTLEPLLVQASAHSEWEPLAHIVVGYLRLIEERLPESLDELQRARQDFRGWGGARFARDAGELLRASLLIALDRGDEAWEVLRPSEQYPHHPLCRNRVIAQLRFRNGDLGGAAEVLQECEALGDDHSMRTLMDVRMLRGAVEFERGEVRVSDGYVDRALATMVRTGSRAPLRAIPAGTLGAIAARGLQRPQSAAARALLESIVATTRGEDRLIDPLSSRELLVLAEVEKGSTVAGIAAALYLSPNTVKTHLRRVYRKLGVATRADAIRKARSLGLGSPVTRESPE